MHEITSAARLRMIPISVVSILRGLDFTDFTQHVKKISHEASFESFILKVFSPSLPE
jgi:hypothetical protein